MPDGLQQSEIGIPKCPLKRGHLHQFRGLPQRPTIDQFAQPLDGSGHGFVEAIAIAAHRGFDSSHSLQRIDAKLAPQSQWWINVWVRLRLSGLQHLPQRIELFTRQPTLGRANMSSGNTTYNQFPQVSTKVKADT
jgi:hypothetical protein